MDLPMGNSRRNAMVSNYLQFSPTSVSMKNIEVERRDVTRLKNTKKTETVIEQNSLYWCHGF
jgi:hypothetical protein